MKPLRSVHIEARLWRDKVNGNTYYSNRIWVDGMPVAVDQMAYGYGNQNEYDALATLINLGYDIPGTTRLEAWHKAGIDFYTSRAWVTKAELWNENTHVSERKEIGEYK
jgi:hypothetical protein